VELWGIYEMECDDDVLEYYDQPIRIQLQYRARSGRKTTQWHTPDFFYTDEFITTSPIVHQCYDESCATEVSHVLPH
jgi:hypothetical protein